MPITFQHDVPFGSLGPAAVAVGQGQKARYDAEFALKQQAEQQQADMEAARLAQQAYQFEVNKDMQAAQMAQAAAEAQAAREQQRELLSLQRGWKLDDYDMEQEDQFSTARTTLEQKGFEFSPKQQELLAEWDGKAENIKNDDKFSEEQKTYLLREIEQKKRRILPNQLKKPDPWKEGDLSDVRAYDPETGLVFTRQPDGTVKSEKAGDTKAEIELREREAIRKEQADQNKHEREIAAGERKEREAEDKDERKRIADLSKNVFNTQQRIIKLKTDMQSRAAKASQDAMSELLKENPDEKPNAATLTARQNYARNQVMEFYKPMIDDAENDLSAFKADQVAAMQSYSLKSNRANRATETPEPYQIPAPEAINDVAQPGPEAPPPAAQPAPATTAVQPQNPYNSDWVSQPTESLPPAQQAAQKQLAAMGAYFPKIDSEIAAILDSAPPEKLQEALSPAMQTINSYLKYAGDGQHPDIKLYAALTRLKNNAVNKMRELLAAKKG